MPAPYCSLIVAFLVDSNKIPRRYWGGEFSFVRACERKGLSALILFDSSYSKAFAAKAAGLFHLSAPASERRWISCADPSCLVLLK